MHVVNKLNNHSLLQPNTDEDGDSTRIETMRSSGIKLSLFRITLKQFIFLSIIRHFNCYITITAVMIPYFSNLDYLMKFLIEFEVLGQVMLEYVTHA